MNFKNLILMIALSFTSLSALAIPDARIAQEDINRHAHVDSMLANANLTLGNIQIEEWITGVQTSFSCVKAGNGEIPLKEGYWENVKLARIIAPKFGIPKDALGMRLFHHSNNSATFTLPRC